MPCETFLFNRKILTFTVSFNIFKGDSAMKREEINDLPEICQQFLKIYLDATKEKSKLTINEYASDLRLFFRFLIKEKNLCDADTDFDKIDISKIDIDFIKTITVYDANMFLSYCRNERNNNSATRSRKISTIKTFFKYLKVHEKLIDDNPMEALEAPKIKKSLPKYLTLEESINLLNSIDGSNKERDYCILTFFLNCGMRLSELCNLNCTDIRPDRTMRITGKGNKERVVYLNDACLNAYNRYMKVRPTDGVKDKKALFISRNLNRISPKTVQLMVNNLLKKCGLDGRGYSVHKLRHTAATLMYQQGHADILLVKEVLGHENLSTTQIYTHVLNDQIKQAIDNNPLNNIEIDASKDKKFPE